MGWDEGGGYWPQLLSANNKLSHRTSETGNSRRKDEVQTLKRKTGKLLTVVGEFLQPWAWSGGEGGAVLQRGLINTVIC